MATGNRSMVPLRDGKVNQARREVEDRSYRGGVYQIKIEGQLDAPWSEWLGGLTVRHDGEGNTLLTGTIPDQSALHGVLGQIRDLGLVLISLKRIDIDDAK